MNDLVGLYVHVPFCSVKCFYCDFTAVAHHGHLAGRYLRAIEAESKLKMPRSPDTLYVGGGTPSELESDQIRELFAVLRRSYPKMEPTESTFECNPESTTPEKLAALAEAGVTRLSLGLQTAEDELLRRIGRRHSTRQFVEIFKAARRAGSFDLSVDLMYNLPGQSLRSFSDSVEFVLGLQPEHVSIYGLQVEDQTLFSRRQVVPDEDAGRAMFELALDRLAEAGFRHYEISNWAKPGHESKHNMIYWRDGEYVGLGCGAASFLDGRRSTNVEKLVDYMSAVEAGRDPVLESERLRGKEKLGETLMLGLRLIDGFAPSGPMWQAFEPEIAALERRGLLQRCGARLKLTRDGVFVANDVFREFVPPYAEAVTAS